MHYLVICRIMCFGDRQRNNVRFRKLRALSRDLPIHREMALRAVLVASYESAYPLISHISQYVDYMESFQVLRLSASCDLAMSREMCRFVVLYMCSICFNCAFLIYYIIMVLFLQWKYKKLLWSLSCNSKSTWRLRSAHTRARAAAGERRRAAPPSGRTGRAPGREA